VYIIINAIEIQLDLTYTDIGFESILGVRGICEEADIQHVACCVLGTWNFFAKCVDKF
jgi:hypothetical protein